METQNDMGVNQQNYGQDVQPVGYQPEMGKKKSKKWVIWMVVGIVGFIVIVTIMTIAIGRTIESWSRGDSFVSKKVSFYEPYMKEAFGEFETLGQKKVGVGCTPFCTDALEWSFQWRTSGGIERKDSLTLRGKVESAGEFNSRVEYLTRSMLAEELEDRIGDRNVMLNLNTRYGYAGYTGAENTSYDCQKMPLLKPKNVSLDKLLEGVCGKMMYWSLQNLSYDEDLEKFDGYAERILTMGNEINLEVVKFYSDSDLYKNRYYIGGELVKSIEQKRGSEDVVKMSELMGWGK